MNNLIANIIKSYIEDLTWIDKISGLVQTVTVKVPSGKDSAIEKSYPVSCSITADACKKGGYQDLCPDSKKKSVCYFEDVGGCSFVERVGNRLKFSCKLRLVVWLNLCLISDDCGSSGTYVIEIIKNLPSVPFQSADFSSIFITNISQVERSASIFSRYSYNEQSTQYLMFPFDYAAIDIDIQFMIPCVET